MSAALALHDLDRLAVAGALSLAALLARDGFAFSAGLHPALELDRGDFLAHVREEAEVSRGRVAQMLTPVNDLHRAVDALGEALRACGRDPGSRCAVKQRCAEIAALAVRIATEGTPVFPATQAGDGR